MFHQACPTDWHQLFLVAAGFLTAILSLWIQSEQRFFYAQDKFDREDLIKQRNKKNIDGIKRRLANRRISYSLWRLWLYGGALFALGAFGITGLDWLFPHQADWIEQLAKGLLIGAFDITIIAVLKTVFLDLLGEYRTADDWITKGKGKEPLNYGIGKMRDLNKRCLLIGICVALALVLACSLILAFIPANHWLWLVLCPLGVFPAIISLSLSWWLLLLCSFIAPALILRLTYRHIDQSTKKPKP